VLTTAIVTGAEAMLRAAMRRSDEAGFSKVLDMVETRSASSVRASPSRTTNFQDWRLWAEGAWLAASRMVVSMSSGRGSGENCRML